MPFTLAHPAAVLLLARGPLSLLALVAGAMAPDLPYYLRVLPLQVTAESWYEPYVNATTSHSWGQLIPVALPMALAIYVCALLVLPPLRWIAGLRSSAAPGRSLTENAARGTWVVVSLAIGVLTHLAWDALTGLGGSAAGLLQHVSTALGLVVVAVVFWRHRGVVRWEEPVVRRRMIGTASVCGLVALAGAAVACWSWLEPSAGLTTSQIAEGVLTDAAKGAGVGLATAATVLSAAWWATWRMRRA